MRGLPKYTTPFGTTCPDCSEECRVIALRDDFDYAASHCTHGRPGTHYGPDHGAPVSDCCESLIESEDVLEYPEYESD